MATQSQFPDVKVAVALIVNDQTILAVYNPQWGSFSLPMTKLRKWNDPNAPSGEREEDWRDAAGRAVAEWFGITIKGITKLVAEIPPYQQSDRDGAWKRYTFQIYQVSVGPNRLPIAGARTEWLTVDEFLDKERRPISPTARHLMGELNARAKSAG